jgi:hypothetical protein
MDAVRLVQERVAANAFEQIGNERGIIFCDEIGVNLSESKNVIIVGVIWQLHSRDDDTHIRVARSYLIDDRLEVVSDFRNGHAAKGVVDAELEDEDVDLAFEMPRKALQSTGGRPAALTRVDDLKAQTRPAQFIGQERRISLARLQTEPLRQAIAENEDSLHR